MSKKVLTMVSLSPEEYPNLEVECEFVDNMRFYVEEYLKYLENKGKFPKQAKKTSKVLARVGEVGEEVDTRPRVSRDGKIYVIGETKNTIKVENSMIVKNPDGEEYIVKPEAFSKKYQETEKEGVYLPVAEPISYIVLTEDIAFMAPWGEVMYGLEGSVLNVSDLENIYAIQNEAFSKTYTILNSEENIDIQTF